MTKHRYFTAGVIGAGSTMRVAIFAGDASVAEPGGGRTLFLRAPMLVVTDMFEKQEELAEIVTEIMNENAHRFFQSARQSDELNDEASR